MHLCVRGLALIAVGWLTCGLAAGCDRSASQGGEPGAGEPTDRTASTAPAGTEVAGEPVGGDAAADGPEGDQESATASPDRSQTQKSDPSPIVGSWRPTEIRAHNQVQDDPDGVTIIFTFAGDGTVSIRSPDVETQTQPADATGTYVYKDGMLSMQFDNRSRVRPSTFENADRMIWQEGAARVVMERTDPPDR